MKQKVAAAFATDHQYRYYTGVTLQSLAEHSSAETEYDILILSDAMSDADQAIFRKIVEGRHNFSLHFIDMQKTLDKTGRDHLSLTGTYNAVPIYFRLFLHELLPQYQKVLYLDSDIVLQADIKELFDTDLGNHAIGAIRDLPMTRPFFSAKRRRHHAYAADVLKMKNPAKYFNSGVILLDLDKLRQSDFSLRVNQELKSNISFKFPDQDILNRIFDGNILELDRTWNYVIESEKNVRSQKLVHFAGIHPWRSLMQPRADLWWAAAEKTFFLQDMKNDLYQHAGRIEHLENVEKLYASMCRSTCWRITGILRAIFDAAKTVKGLLKKRGNKGS